MNRWKNLVETAREASQEMEPGDKKFAFYLLAGVGATALCVAGLVWQLFRK